jgi:hypothetical protein
MPLRQRRERVRIIDDSAFLIQRDKPHERKPDAWFRSPRHYEFIHAQPCHYCEHTPGPYEIQACHVRKGTDGAGEEKPSDYFLWPGCCRCHRIQGSMSEPAFHRDRGTPDPVRMALEYALRSWCPRTVAAAREEVERRGYRNA